MVQPTTYSVKEWNSYSLETLKGDPIQGTFSTRRLWRFVPQEGTRLAEEQRHIEERCVKEEQVRKVEEVARIELERKPCT